MVVEFKSRAATAAGIRALEGMVVEFKGRAATAAGIRALEGMVVEFKGTALIDIRYTDVARHCGSP